MDLAPIRPYPDASGTLPSQARHEGGVQMSDDRERRWAAVGTHRERLLCIARARLDNRYDAEDCVQEAMLRAVEFDGLDEARLGQFLTTVTMRLCADVHRGRSRGERLSLRLGAQPGVEPGPEDAVCDRAESAWLSRHFDTLPPRQRAVVEARAEGLSCAAVAERLLLSYAAVESALARVRRSMRGALEATLGLAALPRWRRVARAASPALLASATVFTVLHLGPSAPAAPRVETATPRRVVSTRPVAGVVAHAARHAVPARAAVAAPPRRVAQATPGAPAAGDRGRQRERAPFAGASGPVRAGVYVERHGYTARERWMHCVEEGVDLGPTVHCRYPGERDDAPGTPGLGSAR
jgi:RNA polymerase sigma factor (sigma-70 family)